MHNTAPAWTVLFGRSASFSAGENKVLLASNTLDTLAVNKNKGYNYDKLSGSIRQHIREVLLSVIRMTKEKSGCWYFLFFFCISGKSRSVKALVDEPA